MRNIKMLRAILLSTIILCTACGSASDPAERKESQDQLSEKRSRIILAYEVRRKAGENLRSISRRFHVPVEVLERFNPRAGQGQRQKVIYVPIANPSLLRSSALVQPAPPIVKLKRDAFLRPIRVGTWSAVQEERYQTLDEWFLPDEDQRLSFPVEGYISSGFSWRWNRFHKGLDIAARAGTPIYAAQDGKVTFRGWRSGFGLLVIIQHKLGKTYYAHCQTARVKIGQTVSRGDMIASVGATGQSRGPHLHFEYRDAKNQPLDPTVFLMPPCSRPVNLSAQTAWSAKATPCQSSDL